MCSSEASQRRAIADSMPAPEKPPNSVIYMPQLHLSDSLLAEAIVELFKSRRDWEGSRAGAHQKVLKDLRKTCLDELRMNAAEMGADAVIGVDLDYSEISGKNGGLLMLVASGTAVKLEPKE